MNTPMPHSVEAERAVLGRILQEGAKVAGTVVGTLLEASHFYSPAHRLIYEAIVEAYYADEPMDALTIGELCSKRLAKLWDCDEQAAVQRVCEMADSQTFGGEIVSHARLIKRDSDYRLLLGLAKAIEDEVSSEEKNPEEIAGVASTRAMRIATNTLLTHEIKSTGDLGREFIVEMRQRMEARKQGIEMGAIFNFDFIDDYIHGLQPTELWFLAGLPGEGKTAIAYAAGINFARRQLTQPPERRIGTFILSLEMGELPSKMRIAQTLTGVNSTRMRDGSLSEVELDRILNAWGREKDLPLYWNFTSHLKASQMRAVITEAIRRHNVGLVIIDHFRHFRMDQRYENRNQEDEDKVLFLKEALCKDLNVAVICLAHTTKFNTGQDRGRRPVMGDLRGSGQIAATADFVSFLYRPYEHAVEADKEAGLVRETQAEMIWAKDRHGETGTAELYFDPSRMAVK